MDLELWSPKGQQLKAMTRDWMRRRMGQDWEEMLPARESHWRVRSILGWEGECCYFLMTAEFEPEDRQRNQKTQEIPRQKTLTEQLYGDSLGTALLDSGRSLLLYEVERRMKIPPRRDISQNANRRYVLGGPGLDGVPIGAMRRLYKGLEGWRIGISINRFGILAPEKSCGGWYEPRGGEDTGEEAGGCQPGTGCLFCQLWDGGCRKGERE